jgi:hypothetical protein
MAYDAAYPKGSWVRVVSRSGLEMFRDTWKSHHKLEEEQFLFGDRVAQIKSIGYYHGGDVLYELEDVPGIWHERCLRAAQES